MEYLGRALVHDFEAEAEPHRADDLHVAQAVDVKVPGRRAGYGQEVRYGHGHQYQVGGRAHVLLAEHDDHQGVAKDGQRKGHGHDVPVDGDGEGQGPTPFGSVDVVARLLTVAFAQGIDLHWEVDILKIGRCYSRSIMLSAKEMKRLIRASLLYVSEGLCPLFVSPSQSKTALNRIWGCIRLLSFTGT